MPEGHVQDIRIRRMQEEDIGAVLEIEKGLTGRTWTEQSFRESLARPEAHFYVAVKGPAQREEDRDGQILAYCCSYTVLGESEIVNVAVRPRDRRRGIGRLLLEAVLTEEQDLGTDTFVLEVRRSNTPAQRLYQDAGFEECGVRRDFYEMPAEDALVMTLCCHDVKGNRRG